MNLPPEHPSRRFDPAKVERLLSPDRAAWLRPDLILDALSLRPGLRLLDFGAGPGYFSLPIARRINSSGGVVAADVEPLLLELLRQRAAEAGVEGIVPIVCDHHALPFHDGVFDRVLMSLVLHEVDEPERLLDEAFRVVATGGQAVLVEWRPGQTEHGPPADHRISPAQATHKLRTAGFLPGEPVSLSADCYVLAATKSSRSL
jgi:ubiquinone/menaquinone biosynthesis C-methylase UbiE